MQTTIPTSKPSLWQALRDLDFLSAFFSWFFMLLTRLSEPLMLLATLYVVAETGVPAIATIALHNLAIGIMITAPEIILPGAFVVASRSKEHARTLFGICWAFVILTAVTLVSLFVWHLTGQALAWLMCARCAAAVGYSILMRVMNHSKKVELVQQSVPDLRVQLAAVLSEQVAKKVEEMQSAVVTKMSGLEKTIEQQTTAQKSVPIGQICEQFGYFEMGRMGAEVSGEIAWELVEYGAASVPDETALEGDGQPETLPTFTPQFVQTLTQHSPSKEAPKGPYVMTYEEAATYTGLTIRTLKSKVNSGDIEESANGKLKVKSLEKLRRKSPLRVIGKAATSEQMA